MDIRKILFKTNEIDVEKSLPDATIFFLNDGKIQWVNDKAAEIFETSKMHLLTSNISDFIENALNMIHIAAGDSSIIIVKLLAKDVFFDMTAKETEDGFVITLRDIKNQAEAKSIKDKEDEYRSINREKNAFLLKLTNDLKTPLQSIVGFSQAMADGLGGEMSEQQEKYIKIIKKNSSDLMYFITKLLELSQTEVDLKAPEFKTFDLVNTINTIIKFNEQLYKGKDYRWTTKFNESIKNTIISDENVIKNILQNIIDVILKSVDMGEISISASLLSEEFIREKNLKDNNYILLSVSSTSLMLSDIDLENMFDPYKVIDGTNRKNLLRAIILSSVKNLVESIDGYVWVESTILKNTSFNIIIPSGKN